MQKHQQKVKCEDTLRAGKERIKQRIATPPTVMAAESATGATLHFSLPPFTGKAS
jgi:hypothetical protein